VAYHDSIRTKHYRIIHIFIQIHKHMAEGVNIGDGYYTEDTEARRFRNPRSLSNDSVQPSQQTKHRSESRDCGWGLAGGLEGKGARKWSPPMETARNPKCGLPKPFRPRTIIPVWYCKIYHDLEFRDLCNRHACTEANRRDFGEQPPGSYI
jgi:hypothetical protein